MCKVLEASRSAYYIWVNKDYTSNDDKQLLFKIKEIYDLNNGIYGSRRITKILQSEGVSCYQNKVVKLMRINGVQAKTRRKYIHKSSNAKTTNISDNLVNRDFKVDLPNKVWVGDITYIWTKNTWVYLSTVIDLYSRKIVGWSISSRMTKELITSSLNQAIDVRKPDNGFIFHSDQGSQYASNEFKNVIAENGGKASMSRRGNCWDNAVAESFFKTIKTEMIYWNKFNNLAEAELKVFEYIEMFYNTKRLHSTNNYLSPNDYEKLNNS